MRRSLKVSAPLLAATAVTLAGGMTGCERPEMRRCVDADHMVVAEEMCTATGEQRILGQQPKPAGTYRWYYGGRGTHEAGTIAEGGSFIKDKNHNYETTKVETRRGGFGQYWPAIAIGSLVSIALVIGAGE